MYIYIIYIYIVVYNRVFWHTLKLKNNTFKINLNSYYTNF